MLQTQTVSSNLLELLEKIMKLSLFNDYLLVGGTSLALQMGHRNSIGIDLFGNCEIDEELFTKTLNEFGTFEVFKKSKNILITSINGVKVDFVNYKYFDASKFMAIKSLSYFSDADINQTPDVYFDFNWEICK